MTDDQELSVLLHDWLIEGPREMPDRVIDVVAQRIRRQPQRHAWRLDRRLSMNTSLKAAAALAAVIVVAVIGYTLLPSGSSGVGGPSPSPSTTPTATPTGTPAATGPTALADGVLTGGQYGIKPFGASSSLSIRADIPAPWLGYPEIPAVTSPAGNNDGILIAFMTADGLYSDPCHWDLDGTGTAQTGGVVVGPTVGDLVTALKANESYTSSAASPITIGGFEGQELELQLPGNDVISTCDRRKGQTQGDYFVFPNGFYAQGPNSRWHLYIVDVRGTRLITMVSISEGASEADIAAAQAIVQSFDFTP
jgi:hypothetical protein